MGQTSAGSVGEISHLFAADTSHLELPGVGFWVCDQEGRLLDASPNLLDHIGYSREECIGFRWLRAIPDGDDPVRAWLRLTEDADPFTQVQDVCRPDGTRRTLLTRGAPSWDEGEIVAWTGVAVDVTDERSEHEELSAAHEALSQLTRLSREVPSDGTYEDVAAVLCGSARLIFDCDAVGIWRVDGEQLVLAWRDPFTDEMPPGATVDISGWPELLDDIRALRREFITLQHPDTMPSAKVEEMRRLGVGATLRLPFRIVDSTDAFVGLSWREPVNAPSDSMLEVAERFADLAALVLLRALHRTERLRNALHVNDNILQALAVADLALETGDDEQVHAAIAAAMAATRDIVSELADIPALPLAEAGELRRDNPPSIADT